MARNFFSKAVKSLHYVNFAFLLTCILFLNNARAAGPPFPFPGSSQGQQAIEALADRLPAVAFEYGKSAERLQEILLQNKDLWLDQEGQLVYLCTFELQEGEIPEEAAGEVSTTRIKTTVTSTTFTVTNVTLPGYMYDPASNDSIEVPMP